LPWHYAPRTPLRLIGANQKSAMELRTGLLWFGATQPPEGYAQVENLSPQGDLREAATNLFATLHRLDAAGLARIDAAVLPETGLGRAVNERLSKAAAAPVDR